MVSGDFQMGDPVWAKMKNYPPWPAKIVDPPPSIKPPKNKKGHCVYFFGAGNFAWIPDENISPHSESMLQALSKKKSPALQTAIDEICSYVKTHKRGKVSSPQTKGERSESVIPKKKKEKTENNLTRKVVKVINSVSKKHDRKVIIHKSTQKRIHRKRSLDDINGDSSDYFQSKSRKVRDYSPLHHSPLRDVPQYRSFYPEDQGKRYIRDPKHVEPSHLNFGFIGLGMMGKQIVKTLIMSGHKISVWNKTSSQCDIFRGMGAKKARTPADLIVDCDITFCCVSDPEASKAVIFSENGVLKGLERAESLGKTYKGYVEMTSIDPATSQGINEAVTMKRGVYLEAPLCGTSKDAEEGTLLILAAGDRKLFMKCETCFHAIGKNAYYVSCDVGAGSQMNVILSTFSGVVCSALAEAMVLVERLKLQKEDFVECIKNGPLNCETILEKAQKMANLDFQKVTALKYIQKDIGFSLLLGNALTQHMPVTAVANEVYKHGRLSNYSNEDMSAVYKVARY